MENQPDAPPKIPAIDALLPGFDFSSAHDLIVECPPDTTYAAILTADFGRSPLVRGLMFLRGVPTVFARRRRPPASGPEISSHPFRSLLGVGFTLLAEDRPWEIVLGLQGQFWRLDGGLCRLSPEEFREPVPQDMARAVWNFSLKAHPAGTLLRTETRVACGDPATRRRFAPYWTVIRPFSGLSRKSVLAEIRRNALFLLRQGPESLTT